MYTYRRGLRRCIGVVSALYIERSLFLFVTYLIISRYTIMQTQASFYWVTRKNQQNEKQILCNKFCYPTTIFPVTSTSRTIFTGGKKKDVLLVYGCQPKPIHKYKFIHLRIYILMDWMNWTNCGAIAQPCHVQYWVVALFLSASKNSCMISVTFHL